MNTKFTSAPLPFQGQKRMFIREFSHVLQATFSDTSLFVDLFGGSGLLSRTVKDTLPHAHVVYNDYDHYTRRLAHIPQTNALLTHIRCIVAKEKRGQKLSESAKQNPSATIYASGSKPGILSTALPCRLRFFFPENLQKTSMPYAVTACTTRWYSANITQKVIWMVSRLSIRTTARYFNNTGTSQMWYSSPIHRTSPQTNRVTKAIGVSLNAWMYCIR